MEAAASDHQSSMNLVPMHDKTQEENPTSENRKKHIRHHGRGKDHMNHWLYDILLWAFSIILDLFFREVHPRGSWKIPRSGPVIFVAAPHANQFIDPLILMRLIRQEGRRRVSFLIAESSLHRWFIGWAARSIGAVGVGRALDNKTAANGTIYLKAPVADPLLIGGAGTNFLSHEFQPGALLVLPPIDKAAATAEIAEILDSDHLRLKKPFKGDAALGQLTERTLDGRPGTSFKIAPKIDQTKVYNQVFNKLSQGGCVGIFPEGGSHDRTELLPLKAGVAIMALGAVAADPDCGLKVVPCGMNYFHAHKFRSRAVVEFGTAIDIPRELVEEYKNGSRRDAVGKMLEIVYNSLVAVTVTSPDYETLMLIQAVRRLYNPNNRRLPLPVIVELNRRLVRGYTKYKDDPRIVQLKKNVMRYNKQLLALNLRDHQLQDAKLSMFQIAATLVYRFAKLVILSSAVLPGLILFAPVFIAGKVISIRKSREALAASTVKVQGRDVIATWKLLVAMALAPALYTYYTLILTSWTYYNRVQGWVSESIPLWTVVVFGYVFFPVITFAALRFGEIGMDIAKSLRPLVLALNPASGNTLIKLQQKRDELATEVTNLINELGPEMFPDFDSQRLISGDKSPESPGRGRAWSDVFRISSRDPSPTDPSSPRSAGAGIGGGSSFAGHLPRNESFKSLSNIALFASRPQTPTTHSRANSHSRPASSGETFGLKGTSLKGLSTLDTKEALDDMSKRIRGAMQERGQARVNGIDHGDEGSDSGSWDSTTNGDELSMKKNA